MKKLKIIAIDEVPSRLAKDLQDKLKSIDHYFDISYFKRRPELLDHTVQALCLKCNFVLFKSECFYFSRSLFTVCFSFWNSLFNPKKCSQKWNWKAFYSIYSIFIPFVNTFATWYIQYEYLFIFFLYFNKKLYYFT